MKYIKLWDSWTSLFENLDVYKGSEIQNEELSSDLLIRTANRFEMLGYRDRAHNMRKEAIMRELRELFNNTEINNFYGDDDIIYFRGPIDEDGNIGTVMTFDIVHAILDVHQYLIHERVIYYLDLSYAAGTKIILDLFEEYFDFFLEAHDIHIDDIHVESMFWSDDYY